VKTLDDLRRIYREAKTIAVVGASAKPGRAAHEIPSYMRSQGYRVIPVSPRGGELFGEPVRASLGDIDGATPLAKLLGEDGYAAFLKASSEAVLTTEPTISRLRPEWSNPAEPIVAAAPDFWRPKPVVANKGAKEAPKAISEKIRIFMSRVTVKADEDLLGHYPKSWPARLVVAVPSGKQEKLVLHVPGDPERPFDEVQVSKKFRRVTAPILGKRAADALLTRSLAAFDEPPEALLAEIERACVE